MHDLSAYQIKVKGQLEQHNFNMTSPFQITVEKSCDAETTFNVFADQSGLVGLIRFLHQQGFLIFCVLRQQ